MRVLVCDRDPRTVALIRRFVEGRGHEVAVAYDEGEAHRQLIALWPDLVILDATTVGLGLLRRMRESPSLEHIFCTVLTACPDPAAILLAYRIGADMVLTKPFNPQELVP